MSPGRISAGIISDGLKEKLMEEILHQPYNCPRDVYELMLECWAKHTEDRPDFQVVA